VWQRVEGGSDGNFANVTLNSTDAGATASPLLDLYRNSASPAASDTIGEIEFNGQDSAGNKQAYALFHGSILSPTSGAEQGQLHFETATAGALTEKMIIGTTNLVINDIGAIYNVRIEGDTDANLFFTDATNSRVGIGIITPAEKLDVVGNIKLSGNVIPASGFGIDFAATAGTGTSELLADYEEGTWSPVVGGNATYTFQEGYYTKVGRVVTVTFVLIINVLGTGSTTIMSGLPFASGAPNRSGGSMAYWTDLATNVLYLAPFVTTGNSSLSFISQTASGVTVTDSAAIFGNSASVQGTVTYMTS
jgi:hypothetical protein